MVVTISELARGFGHLSQGRSGVRAVRHQGRGLERGQARNERGEPLQPGTYQED